MGFILGLQLSIYWKMQENNTHKIDLHKIVNLNPQRDDVSIAEWEGRQVLKNVCGHNSFFLRKPVIQGDFYVEMIGYKPEFPNSKLKYESNFRVGVVPTEYYYNYPLGQAHSIAYKADGSIITNSNKFTQLVPYTFGDHIGVGIKIQDVFKDRDKSRRAPKNSVCFFKNGAKVSPDLHILTQDLFSFAGSLYNGAMIEVKLEEEELKFRPEGYRAYGEHLREKIMYKDNEMKSFEFDF